MGISKNIKITGIVQGVGFRPFVCKNAKVYNIKGWVLNDSSGVFIHCESDIEENLLNFISEIKNNPPALAKIDEFNLLECNYENFKDFTIRESHKTEDPYVFISPDVCTCEDCKNDIINPNSKRYYYPFTNCTNCGPRFSIIKEVPYDRKLTTMSPFKQCDSCIEEYTNIDDRRFHAQPNCCPSCGPSISILDNLGHDITPSITIGLKYNSSDYNKTLIKFFQDKIIEGKIWAMKGLSGFHLCCSPYKEEIVQLLRNRKHRPKKPLALLMKDINTVKKYCYVSKEEEKLLLDKSRPIVLLKKKENNYFPENIAPNNNMLGVMLPSTPLHILIMENSPFDALIMTSGNLSGLPLEYENTSSVKSLVNFVDYFLTNNRDIVLPLDDSIVRIINNKQVFIRRSRGFVPTPINYKNCGEILALGGDIKNTFSVSKRNYIYLGPYTGDLGNTKIIERLKSNINRYLNMFEASPKIIACDLNPDFHTSKIAKEYDLPIIQVQHHHAHIASCMADNKYTDKVIGISFDASGYGDDNCIWGSEFFINDLKEYKRVGHLEYVDFISGDESIRDGDKLALSYLHNLEITEDVQKLIDTYYKGNYELIFKLLKHNKLSYKSSSMGRFFDSISSLLGICHHSNFEGEAAIALESILKTDELVNGYSLKYKKENDTYLLSPLTIIKEILEDLKNDTPKEVIALKFHSTIVNYITSMCIKLRDEYNINTVALSGGVFQNKFILTNSCQELCKLNFNVLTHNEVPCNDSGISLGQILIAKENI